MGYLIVCVISSGGFASLISYVDQKNFLKPERRALLMGAAVATIVTAIFSFFLGVCELAGVQW